MLNQVPALPAQTFAQRGIAGKLSQPIRQSLKIAWGHEKAGFIVAANFAGAITIISHHGPRGSQGLWQSPGQSLSQGQMHQDVHDTDQRWHLSGSNQTGEDESVFQPGRSGALFQAVAPGTISDQQKFYLRAMADKNWRNFKQIVMPLKLEQPRDFADDKILWLNTELASHGGIVAR